MNSTPNQTSAPAKDSQAPESTPNPVVSTIPKDTTAVQPVIVQSTNIEPEAKKVESNPSLTATKDTATPQQAVKTSEPVKPIQVLKPITQETPKADATDQTPAPVEQPASSPPVLDTKESVKQMMEGITSANICSALLEARKLKIAGNWEGCLDMIEAMIKKGGVLFGSDSHPRLAEGYYRLGDVLLQKLEDSNELFGDRLKTKKGDGAEGQSKQDPKANVDREEEIKVAWENLEIARIVLEKHLVSFEEGKSEPIQQENGKILRFLRLGGFGDI